MVSESVESVSITQANASNTAFPGDSLKYLRSGSHPGNGQQFWAGSFKCTLPARSRTASRSQACASNCANISKNRWQWRAEEGCRVMFAQLQAEQT